MDSTQSSDSTPIVAAVFDVEEDTARALEALRQAGVQPEQVSLMMSQQPSVTAQGRDPGAEIAGGAASGATMGGLIGGLAGGLLGLAALVIPGIGPVLGTGILGSLLAGAAVGAAAGGLLGGLVGLGIPEDEARAYESQVRAGRLLLTIHPPDLPAAQRLRAVLEANGAHDVRVYEGATLLAVPAGPVPAAPVAGPPPPEPMLPLPANVEITAPEPAGTPVSNIVEDVIADREPALPSGGALMDDYDQEGRGVPADTANERSVDPGAAPAVSDAGSAGHLVGTGLAGAGTGTSIGPSRGNTGPGTGSDAAEQAYGAEPPTPLPTLLGVGPPTPEDARSADELLAGQRAARVAQAVTPDAARALEEAAPGTPPPATARGLGDDDIPAETEVE